MIRSLCVFICDRCGEETEITALNIPDKWIHLRKEQGTWGHHVGWFSPDDAARITLCPRCNARLSEFLGDMKPVGVRI